jgi:hypothetical protein
VINQAGVLARHFKSEIIMLHRMFTSKFLR